MGKLEWREIKYWRAGKYEIHGQRHGRCTAIKKNNWGPDEILTGRGGGLKGIKTFEEAIEACEKDDEKCSGF